ncbi:trypsin-1-like [Chelonus insularis]|uniref:trypsin-1-like n=1 Tax=Chelonus insularis TaxID=460826 RepID=UPI00158F6747|nr:trypsin-1-like [Chelonus insularis]
MFIQYIFATILLAEACLAGFSRITDGVSAKPHEFPYQVSIVWGIPPLIKYRHVCGGSVLTKDWVLTAGHCVTELPKIGRMGVQAGKHYIDRHEPGQENREVSLRVVHHNYPGGVAQHDIALLRLKTPLTFNDHVQPVALPKAHKLHKGSVVLSGWGSTSKGWLPIMPKELQKAKIPIVDYDTCFESFNSISSDFELFDTQICTGPIGDSISACSGDSGGPLVQFDSHGKPEQVGIVSWGNYPCGKAGTPSVYTRVSSYVDWINSKLEAS